MILAGLTDPTSLVQFGVLGIIFALVLIGWIWPKPAVDELQKRLERSEARNDTLVETYQKEILPALGAARDGTEEVLKMAAGMIDQQKATDLVLAEVKALLLARREA